MKTLKAVTVLLLTAALFFSCAQENMDEYGTLVINFSGTGSSRSVTGVISGEFDGKLDANNISYSFECINAKAGITITAGPYEVGVPKDVPIQLIPGDWVVRAKVLQSVLQSKEEIGSAQYRPVTIKAGQTVILGGISVPISPYGVALAKKVENSAFKNEGYKDANNDTWLNAYTLNINRFIKLNPANGYVKEPAEVDPHGTGAHGTAKILWDDDDTGHLYVLVLVKGNNPIATKGKQDHDTDSVEIFVFEGNLIAHQYRKNYAGLSTYNEATRSPISSDTWDVPNTNLPPLPSTVSLEIKKLPTDTLPPGVTYAVIAKIPFDTPKESRDQIGVEIQINGTPLMKDTSGDDRRSTVAVWCSETSPYDKPGKYANSLTLID